MKLSIENQLIFKQGATSVAFIMLYFNNIYFFDAKFNLALEETLFQSQLPEPILMLWQNNNSVIIGKNQYTQNEINQEYVKLNNIEVVRRNSGGGAVFHDLGNLNYSIIFDKRLYNSDLFINLILKALKSLGISAIKTGRNDITINNFKLSGTSINIKKNKVLLHGTILVDSDLNKLSNSLTPPKEKFETKRINSVRARVININHLRNKNIPIDCLKKEIIKSFKTEFDILELNLNKNLINSSKKLKNQKYCLNSWNYNSKNFNIIKTKRFNNGIINLSFELKHKKIYNIKIYGDFFSRKDIVDLQNYLNKIELSNLEDYINKINIDDYILGISNDEFLKLFRGIN